MFWLLFVCLVVKVRKMIFVGIFDFNLIALGVHIWCSNLQLIFLLLQIGLFQAGILQGMKPSNFFLFKVGNFMTCSMLPIKSVGIFMVIKLLFAAFFLLNLEIAAKIVNFVRKVLIMMLMLTLTL